MVINEKLILVFKTELGALGGQMGTTADVGVESFAGIGGAEGTWGAGRCRYAQWAPWALWAL